MVPPLQAGSRVSLKKKAWQHVVGVITRPVGDGQFLVHWDVPVEGGTIKTGVFKRRQLKHAAPAPADPASAPSAPPSSEIDGSNTGGNASFAHGDNLEHGNDAELSFTSATNSVSTCCIVSLRSWPHEAKELRACSLQSTRLLWKGCKLLPHMSEALLQRRIQGDGSSVVFLLACLRSLCCRHQ
jgi:hypothetical protein